MANVWFHTRTGTLRVGSGDGKWIGAATEREERFKQYFIVKSIDKGYGLKEGQKFTIHQNGCVKIEG
jgi:hypothetical protein